jgi:2-amino-4-hydroxy-6-hydroxymethyldihydropteridine diphosphokinase
VSPLPQPDYLNTVALGTSVESPEALLGFALELERRAGRRRDGERDAPRPLDIDLLFVGDERRDEPGLVLPHPRLRSRRFVLQPLADLAPRLALPPDGATVQELLAALPPGPRVERLAAAERPAP